MDIVVCGISHKTAPVEMLERLAFTPESHAGVLTRLTVPDEQGRSLAKEAILLSTCNRVELYALVEDGGSGATAIARFLADYHGMPYSVLAAHIYSYEGRSAVRHLFTVASGLDSMILGEPQILGQVRHSYETASVLRAAGPVLSTLFRRGIEAAKRVHTDTSISHRAASVSYAAVEMAIHKFGELGNRHVLVIGAGKTGQLTAQCLLGRGAGEITVANRSLERAVTLAEQWHGKALSLDDLGSALPNADIVISSTDAPGYIVTAEQIAVAMENRQDRPLLLIDIAVPRDIDPAGATIPGVQVCNLDDLNEMVELNLRDRGKDKVAAQRIVAEEVDKYMTWFSALAVTPTIVTLRQHAESIRQQELERAIRRLNTMSPHDLDVIEMLTQRIVNQLLHEPTVRLKHHAGSQDGRTYVEAISDLFALNDNTAVGE